MGKPPSPLGNLAPWSWAIEPVRGCNLRCGHCAVRLFDTPEGKHQPEFMSEDSWVDLWKVIRQVTPGTRVEMANAGEPTLHPMLPAFIQMARRISPHSQIQVTTNGTMLAKGKLTHKQLFDAGINIVYVDMYAPEETHIRLAEESGIQWYKYHDKPKNAPGAWTYSGPDLQLIVLMDHPGNWPKSRKNLNRLGTFFNNLDWEAAKAFDMVPVTEPPAKGCTQPFRYVSVQSDGSYQLCCQDFMGETGGTLGNVSEGVEGFKRFWFGEFMQTHRAQLRVGNRADSPYCSRCSITFSRSEWKMWKDHQLRLYWDGSQWKPLDPNDTEAAEAAAKATKK